MLDSRVAAVSVRPVLCALDCDLRRLEPERGKEAKRRKNAKSQWQSILPATHMSTLLVGVSVFRAPYLFIALASMSRSQF